MSLIWGATCSAAWWQGDLLIVNEDNDHYFKLPAEQMTEAALRSYVDSYAGTKVTHLFFCATGQRASYRSAVHDAIWDAIDGKPPKTGNLWAANAKLLWSRGIDPYAVWTDQCRKRGLSPWISQRMNDCHHANNLSCGRNSNFWRSRRDLWRIPSSMGAKWNDRALDYSKEDVFVYELGITRELLERYDMDGIEIDWMRNPWCLTPGRERGQSAVLTRFMREVRRLARIQEERRGHPVRVGVRLPLHPDAARNLGFDFPTWAREGLVDLISATTFYGTVDTDFPADLWRQALGETSGRVALTVGLDEMASSGGGFRGSSVSPAMIRGWADVLAARGIRNIYLFNYPYLRDGSGVRTVTPAVRRAYQDLLQRGPFSEGVRSWFSGRRDVSVGVQDGAQLPWVTDTPRIFTLNVGTPPSGMTAAVLGFSEKDAPRVAADFRVTLNGVPPVSCRERTEGERVGGPDIGRNLIYLFPAGTVYRGANKLSVIPPPEPFIRVGWVELTDRTE